ncbi:MAG: hypothetical protein ABSE27_12250 [Acidobacteriaceae bacterium]|jgi:hypothetical protein
MSTTAEASIAPLSRKRLIQITALAWFAVIGLDFFLDAGLLARFYRWDLPGFLPPLKMFQFIPFGYAAFLLWTILLVWLMTRLSITGFRAGAIFGLKVGVLLAAAGFFGQLSVFAFPASMLLLWLVANTSIFTIAGAVTGAALAAQRLRPLARRVVALVLLCLVGGIVLQNIGPNPAAKIFPGRVGIHWDKN